MSQSSVLRQQSNQGERVFNSMPYLDIPDNATADRGPELNGRSSGMMSAGDLSRPATAY